MKPFFQNVYIGFIWLFLYALFNYFGSIQRMNSPIFASYLHEKTKLIKGSGAVFGLIALDPVVQLIASIALIIVLSFVFLVLRLIFMKVFSVKVATVLYTVCLLSILYLILLFGIDLIDYISWGFYILAMQNVMMILFGVFAIGHLKSLSYTATSVPR